MDDLSPPTSSAVWSIMVALPPNHTLRSPSVTLASTNRPPSSSGVGARSCPPVPVACRCGGYPETGNVPDSRRTVVNQGDTTLNCNNSALQEDRAFCVGTLGTDAPTVQQRACRGENLGVKLAAMPVRLRTPTSSAQPKAPRAPRPYRIVITAPLPAWNTAAPRVRNTAFDA